MVDTGVVGSVARWASAAWSSLTKHHKIVWKAIFFVQLLVVIVVTVRLTSVLVGSGKELSEFHNNYCKDHTNLNISGGPIVNGTHSEDCVYDYKFKKVVYFWCDGMSWDTSGKVFDVFPNNSHIFKVRHRDNPWSAWVFATSVTGKADRNMGTVKSDNLIYQFFLAGLKVFLGVEKGLTSYVFNQLDLSYQDGADTVRYYPGVQTDTEDRMFRWLFGRSGEAAATTASVNGVLDKVKSEDRSIFFESFILDHVVHLDLSKNSPRVTRLRDQLAADLVYVKQWIDQNPDYLLVLVSDHGQISAPTELQIHGNWLANGNEGWMMFYNPNFGFSISSQSKPIKLETVDMAPTFWQFFSANGVSIPAENAGKVYPITNNPHTRYKALKTNAIQIRDYIKSEKLFDYDDHKFVKANNYAAEGNYESAAAEMDSYVEGFTDKYYKEGARIPWEFPLFVSLISLIATIILQYKSFRLLGASIRAVGVGVLMSPFIAWIIMAVFFAQSSDRKLRHQVYVYVIPLCSFIASYTLKRMSTLPADFERPQNKFELLERNEIPHSYDDESSTSSDDSEELINYNKPNVVEESQFLYVEVIDRLRERQYLTAVTTILDFIIGNKQVNRSSIDYWLLHSLLLFGVFSSFEISFTTRHFIFEDIGGLYKHPPFYHALAVMVLYVEFRWQRILLTSHLHVNRNSLNWFKQILHPSLMPLNLKMIGYYILLSFAFEVEEGAHATARIVYGITFVHIAILMLCPTYFQRDLLLPMFVLTYMVNTPQEKILLCFYVLVLMYFSNSLDTPNTYNRYVVPSMCVIFLCLSHFYFAVLYELPYSIDTLNLSIPGIEDVTKYPKFSVLMMGVHYVGVFIMLIPFMIRLVTPVPPLFTPFKFWKITFGYVPLAMSPKKATHESVGNRRVLLTFLTFCTCLTAFLYYIFSMDTVSDVPLIWCFMICTVTIGYGVSVVGNELVDGIVQLAKFFIFVFQGQESPCKEM